jgi:metal-responsive CopG/Arc/MetJ family transcriptional regulator
MRNAVRMNVRTNLLLPADLVEELDEVAGPRNRSRFVADAVRYKLRREKLRKAWAASFGILSAEDHPHWATSEKVVEWVRMMRAEETDPGSDPIPKLSDPRAPGR